MTYSVRQLVLENFNSFREAEGNVFKLKCCYRENCHFQKTFIFYWNFRQWRPHCHALIRFDWIWWEHTILLFFWSLQNCMKFFRRCCISALLFPISEIHTLQHQLTPKGKYDDSGQEVGRECSHDSWPKLTKGLVHTIWDHVQQPKLRERKKRGNPF